MRRLKTIDYRLGIADRKIRLLSRLNPTNSNKEERKFLRAYTKGGKYNPIFRYRPISINLGRVENELNSIYIDIPTERNERWFFSKYLEHKRKRIIEKLNSLQERGTVNFANYTNKLFGAPSRAQTEYAESYLSPDKCSSFSLIKNDIPSYEAARILQGHINKNSLPWRVKLRSSISSKAGLDSRSRYLLIKTDEWFSKEEIASLSVHEIETHIFRKENGSTQQFPYLFGQGFAGPPTTEEGLAFFNETQQAIYDPRRFLIVCARTIASHLAHKKSFYKVFDSLVRRGLPPEHAWATTLRVKRGLFDTSQAGSFAKDHHYLKGYLAIKKYLNEGGSFKALYIGKINTGTVKSIAQLGIEVKEPRYLPSFLK